MEEKLGKLAGLKLAYLGDGNNVAHSLLLGCTKVGMNIAVAGPENYWPLPEITAKARENAATSRCSVLITVDPLEAVKDADIIYTDVWASMGKEEEKAERKMFLLPTRSTIISLRQPAPARW